MITFEYKKVPARLMVDVHGGVMIERLNHYGKEGWELADITIVAGKVAFVYFKRQLNQIAMEIGYSMLPERNRIESENAKKHEK